MTLVEVMFATGVLTIALGGILATFMQSRRLTEGSVYQNAALTIVQGYMEQIKNMDLVSMVGGADPNGLPVLNSTSFTIPVYFDRVTPDGLKTSTGTPPTIASINNGVTPVGVQDNLKGFDMAKDLTSIDLTGTDTSGYGTSKLVPWTTLWPGARDYTNVFPTGSTTGANNLHLNVWVWVKDVSTARATKVFSITMIYTWAYSDGGRVRYVTNSVRCLRSAVPTN